MLADLKYHQFFCVGGRSLLTPVFTNGAHTGCLNSLPFSSLDAISSISLFIGASLIAISYINPKMGGNRLPFQLVKNLFRPIQLDTDLRISVGLSLACSHLSKYIQISF